MVKTDPQCDDKIDETKYWVLDKRITQQNWILVSIKSAECGMQGAVFGFEFFEQERVLRVVTGFPQKANPHQEGWFTVRIFNPGGKGPVAPFYDQSLLDIPGDFDIGQGIGDQQIVVVKDLSQTPFIRSRALPDLFFRQAVECSERKLALRV